jgi:hypothetical protein
MTDKQDCFICGDEADRRDRFTGQYPLCPNGQCETDLDNYLRDMEDDVGDTTSDDPDRRWKEDKEDPAP